MKKAILLSFALLTSCTGAPDPVTELTGTHTRIVWLQDSVKNNDAFALGRNLQLMGYDNQDGKGVRPILSTRSNYTKPQLTADGQRVIYSDRFSREIYSVNFDGSGHKKLSSGYAVDLWRDPQTKVQYIFGSTKIEEDKNAVGFHDIFRFPIDKPDQKQVIWTGGYASGDNFQFSRDGQKAGGLFPWPHGGIADMKSNAWTRLGRGCWTSFAPDNSYLTWIFDGPHRNLFLYDTRNNFEWKINLSRHPAIGGHEVYHPRWSNHVRYMTVTGPYTAGEGGNKIGGGGKDVEIFIGRFTPDFKDLQLVQVTDNKFGDFYPDAWLATGDESDARPTLDRFAKSRKKPNERPVELGGKWPGNIEGLQWLWEDSSKNNLVKVDGTTHSAAIRLDGKSYFGRYGQMEFHGGTAAILNGADRLTAACKGSNELGIEMVIRPAHDKQHIGRIIGLSGGEHLRNFTIGQHYDTLKAWIRTPHTGNNGAQPEIDLGKAPPGVDTHVIFSYRNGRTQVWLNGKQSLDSGIVTGDFSNWDKMQFIAGNESNNSKPWFGKLDGVAIHSRAIGETEALHRYQLYKKKLDARKTAPAIEVDATLTELSTFPTPASIHPYRRCLITGVYKLNKVIKGTFSDEEFVAVHWGILGGSILPEARRKVGQTYRLKLEDYAEDRSQPQLKGERVAADDLKTPDWDLLLPRYYNPL